MNARWLLWSSVLVLFLGSAAWGNDVGLRVAPGFRVTLYSDAELANDIQAMTLDPRGRVVVSGPGWVKRLEGSRDASRPGAATLLAQTPRGGHGLCFTGPDLLCVGDGWLSQYHLSSENKLEEPWAERLSPLAHNDHGGHAVRQGPDGWWYVVGGNDSGFSRARQATLPGSLIREPAAGALVRFTPDFKHSEIIAHGFRNPYGFEFTPLGDLLNYDSDTERDLFLPWYSLTQSDRCRGRPGWGATHRHRRPEHARRHLPGEVCRC